MTLAVPGIVVCMENSRCIAVEVKNPSMSIKLNEFAFLEQYLANASNVLHENLLLQVIMSIFISKMRSVSLDNTRIRRNH